MSEKGDGWDDGPPGAEADYGSRDPALPPGSSRHDWRTVSPHGYSGNKPHSSDRYDSSDKSTYYKDQRNVQGPSVRQSTTSNTHRYNDDKRTNRSHRRSRSRSRHRSKHSRSSSKEKMSKSSKHTRSPIDRRRKSSSSPDSSSNDSSHSRSSREHSKSERKDSYKHTSKEGKSNRKTFKSQKLSGRVDNKRSRRSVSPSHSTSSRESDSYHKKHSTGDSDDQNTEKANYSKEKDYRKSYDDKRSPSRESYYRRKSSDKNSHDKQGSSGYRSRSDGRNQNPHHSHKSRMHSRQDEKKLYRATSQAPAVAPFKNDGSFLEMFKKLQESQEKTQETTTAASTSNIVQPEIKKPVVPLVGKRRGGRVLKTGVVKKPKAIEEQTVDNNPSDAWSFYLKEVKKYRETSCEEEGKTRPLVK